MGNQQLDNNYVLCPYCGKRYKVLTHTHLAKHNKTIEDIYKEYPEYNLYSEVYKNKQRKDAKNRWKDSEYKNKVKETLRYTQNLPEIKKKIAEADKKRWKNHEYHDKVSARIRKTQNDVGKRSYMSEVSSHNLKLGLIGNSKQYRVIYRGEELNLRSSYELEAYQYLIKLNIDFEYENLSYSYIFEGVKLKHITDFYIPKYNLIIEIKPSYKLQKSYALRYPEEYNKILAKQREGICRGYKYIFITEEELSSLESFRNKIEISV